MTKAIRKLPWPAAAAKPAGEAGKGARFRFGAPVPAAAGCVLGRSAVRALDAATIEAGTPALELMERAGAAIARALVRFAPPPALASRLETEMGDGIDGVRPPGAGQRPGLLVLAGSGNNGGDGFVVARLLAAAHWRCTVALCAGEPRQGGEAATNLDRWRRSGGRVIDLAAANAALDSAAPQFEIVLDALLGTGLDRAVDASLADLIHRLNCGSGPSRPLVVAVDIPSGLCADSGKPLGCAVRAAVTIALGAYKPGLFIGQGPDYAGRVEVADIGLLAPSRAGLQPVALALDAFTTAGALTAPPPMSHKGSRGHVLVVAASRGKSGAGVLCARAALRSGAGLVTLAVPRSQQPIVATSLAEVMTAALEEDESGSFSKFCAGEIEKLLEIANSVVFGPGAGTGEGAEAALRVILEKARGPVVLDADALNVAARLGAEFHRLLAVRASRSLAGVVLTPHPGEMAKLTASTTVEVQASRLEMATKLAKSCGCTVVLKGPGTIVTDGTSSAFNTSGNAGMATAGMGDVLAGVIGALAARCADTLDAAGLGVYAHGVAGDICARTIARTCTERAAAGGRRAGAPATGAAQAAGFLAGEVADALPTALVGGICA